MISWWMGWRSEMSANSTNVAPTCHKSVAILMSLGNWTHAISVGAIIVFVGDNKGSVGLTPTTS